MPIPSPSEKETTKEFISRCMSDETMNKEYPNRSQRYAICQNQTKKKSKANKWIEALLKYLNK